MRGDVPPPVRRVLYRLLSRCCAHSLFLSLFFLFFFFTLLPRVCDTWCKVVGDRLHVRLGKGKPACFGVHADQELVGVIILF